MNRKTIYSTHIGAATIMLIFMVLSLVSFAVLTLVNSKADYRLSEKMQERSESYYNACHEANAFIAETATTIQKEYKSSKNKENYTALMDDNTFEKSFYLSDYQTLDVELKAVNPQTNRDDLYSIISYKVTTNDESIKLDESLPVLK